MIEKKYDRKLSEPGHRIVRKSGKAVIMLNYDYPASARFRVIFRDGVQTLHISDIVELYDSRFIDRLPLSDLGFPHLEVGQKLKTWNPLKDDDRSNTIIIRVS